MTNAFKRWITPERAWLISLEALMVSVLVLTVITYVAGQSPHSLQGLAMLTFDTSSVRTDLANQGISNASQVRDWYEPHYLSVCKGMWQSAATQRKNETLTVCTKMAAGYTFSLPKLLATDAGLPADSPLFSAWSFAVLPTEVPFVCLTLALVFLNWTLIDYFYVIVTTPRLTSQSPLLFLKVGYLASVAALNVLIVMAAKLTSMMNKILKAKPVVEDGVAWSTGGFYALTWVATGLMCFEMILSIIFAFKIGHQMRVPRGELERKGTVRV